MLTAARMLRAPASTAAASTTAARASTNRRLNPLRSMPFGMRELTVAFPLIGLVVAFIWNLDYVFPYYAVFNPAGKYNTAPKDITAYRLEPIVDHVTGKTVAYRHVENVRPAQLSTSTQGKPQ